VSTFPKAYFSGSIFFVVYPATIFSLGYGWCNYNCGPPSLRNFLIWDDRQEVNLKHPNLQTPSSGDLLSPPVYSSSSVNFSLGLSLGSVLVFWFILLSYYSSPRFRYRCISTSLFSFSRSFRLLEACFPTGFQISRPPTPTNFSPFSLVNISELREFPVSSRFDLLTPAGLTD